MSCCHKNVVLEIYKTIRYLAAVYCKTRAGKHLNFQLSCIGNVKAILMINKTNGHNFTYLPSTRSLALCRAP